MDKNCVFCGEALIEEAGFCQSCGSPVSSASAPSPDRPALKEKPRLANTLDCYECSMPVALNHKYCASCGADMKNKPATIKPKPKQRKTHNPERQPSAELQLEEFISHQPQHRPVSPRNQPASYHRSRAPRQATSATCRKCGYIGKIKDFYINASLTPLDLVVFIAALIGFSIHFIIGLMLISISIYVSFRKLFMTCPNCRRKTFNPVASIDSSLDRGT